MIDWSVELWDLPTGRRITGSHSLVAALAATLLVFAGAWLDRRRARRLGADNNATNSDSPRGVSGKESPAEQDRGRTEQAR